MPCSIKARAVSAAASSRAASIPSWRRQPEESLIILFFRWRGHDGQLQGANDAQGGRATVRHLKSRGAEVAQRGPLAFLAKNIAGEFAAIRGRRERDEGRYR